MKPIFIAISLFIMQEAGVQSSSSPPNIIAITFDGFRWQKIFEGTDPALLSNTTYVKDTDLLQDRLRLLIIILPLIILLVASRHSC